MSKARKICVLGPLPLHVVRENRRDFSLGRLSVVDLWWVQVGGAGGFGGAEGERGEKFMTQFGHNSDNHFKSRVK